MVLMLMELGEEGWCVIKKVSNLVQKEEKKEEEEKVVAFVSGLLEEEVKVVGCFVWGSASKVDFLTSGL